MGAGRVPSTSFCKTVRREQELWLGAVGLIVPSEPGQLHHNRISPVAMLYTQLLYFTPGPHSVKDTIAALVSDGARPASVQLLLKNT